MPIHSRLLALALSASLLVGCAVDQPYHSNIVSQQKGGAKVVATSWRNAPSVQTKDQTGAKYDLAFVEFNNEGSKWDPSQAVYAKDLVLARSKPLVFIYLHGWHNDASRYTNDVERFKKALAMLSDAKEEVNGGRPIVGVYLGWKGESLRVPVFNSLAYYTRKQAAERLADGYDCFATIRNLADAATDHAHGGRTIVVGHSFGGLVLERAVKSSLTASSVNLKDTLMVELNPATESVLTRQVIADHERRVRFDPAQGYVDRDGGTFVGREDFPSFISVTSKNDRATGWLFPFSSLLWQAANPGRGWSRVSIPGGDPKKPRQVQELAYFHRTPGNGNLVNYDAVVTGTPPPNPTVSALEENLRPRPLSQTTPSFLTSAPNEGEKAAPSYELANSGAIKGTPGSRKLWQLQWRPQAARVPYWNIQVEPEIINDHGGIWSDNSVAMIAAFYRMRFPLTKSGQDHPAATDQPLRAAPESRSFIQQQIKGL